MRIFASLAVFASVWLLLLSFPWERLAARFRPAQKNGKREVRPLWEGLLEARKRARFGAQLANSLDMLSGSLRSGQSLPQALQSAGAELPEPSKDYFRKAASQVALGAQPEEALDGLASEFRGQACGEELRMLSTAVAVTRSTGGNLAEILARLSATLRERQRLRSEIDALTAQGRMSGIIVGGLPVLILAALWILDPQMLKPLFTTGEGLALLALALLMEATGAWLIRRIVAIEA